MTKIWAYERDPYLRELEIEVVSAGELDSRPYAVLDDTLLYPQGGGQPADWGWLGQVQILDVSLDPYRRGASPRHYLSAPVPAGPALLRLDWERRYDHMQQHTAQHLLSALADRLGFATTSFHLGESRSDVELDAPGLEAADLEALEETVAEEIRAARPVTTRRVSQEDYARLAARSRGLPAEHEGDVRLVEIAGIDLNTCGGTHLRSTAEIEALKLLHTEPMRGGTRLYWLAGRRVRRQLEVLEQRSAELRRLLETSDDELVGVVELRLEQQRESTRRERRLLDRLAETVAASLLGRAEAATSEHFEGPGGGDLVAAVSRRFSTLAGTGPAAALLTASDDHQAFFAVAVRQDTRLDLAAVGGAIAQLLGGRGGGRGNLYQGRAGSLEQRGQALELLAASLRA